MPPLAPLTKNEGAATALLPVFTDSSSVGFGSEPVNEKMIDDHLAVQAIIRRFQVIITTNFVESIQLD